MSGKFAGLFAAVVVAIGPAYALADSIGQPTGFDIVLRHGQNTLASAHVDVGPAGDINDLSLIDGDDADFTTIGSLSPSESPIILKVVSEGDATFRLLHMFIDAPLSTQGNDIYLPGPQSLFNPADSSNIEVTITNMTFDGGKSTIPLVVNNNSFFTSYMRDQAGHFYQSPDTNAFNSYGNGVVDIQVPGEFYSDGSADPYNFTGTPGVSSSFSWQNILNPGPNTPIHDGSQGGLPSTGAGYVFELGLAVAFVADPVPEPQSLVLFGIGSLILTRRSRRRA